MLMPFNVTIASLVWSITSLLFAFKGQKTANMWLFLRRLGLQKAGVSAAESSSPAVLSLQITAKTATAPKISQWAPPRQTPSGSVQPGDQRRQELAQHRRPFGVLGA